MLFKEPFPLNLLPPKQEQQTQWITKHHHGLKWEDGAILFVKNILQNITTHTNVIYMKGHEKPEFIKQVVSKPLIKLPEQPPLDKNIPKYFYHSYMKSYCGLYNIFYLYENSFQSHYFLSDGFLYPLFHHQSLGKIN